MDSIDVQLTVNAVVLRMMENAPGSRLNLEAGSTIHDLLVKIGLGTRGSRLLLSVNDRVVNRDTPLAEGDRVTIMPVLGGG
jgi:sulfur carrier protein ThiS